MISRALFILAVTFALGSNVAHAQVSGRVKESDEESEKAPIEDQDEAADSLELPEAVEAAFRAAYPKAQIVGSDVEKDGGET
ncbi:MAG: hypothetical protein WBW88_15810, partial [Rhodothermales bacterium]